jgi:large conductance mechanosensitive channel
MNDQGDFYDDIHDGLLQGEQRIRRGARWFWRDFTGITQLISKYLSSAFLGRDNVLEVALGLIIGAGFSNVVSSLVSDVILPPLSLLSPNAGNLASYFLVLRKGETPDAVYNTVQQAAADGVFPFN